MPFTRPHINLGYSASADRADGVNSLPELVEFNAQHNTEHLFAIQQRRDGEGGGVEITFKMLHQAVLNASAWLVESGATKGRVARADNVKPVAILLGSDVGIFIWMAALTRIGVPVLLLSARLTPVAIAHLVKKTDPSTVLISHQVSRAAAEAEVSLKTEDLASIPAFLSAPTYIDLLSTATSYMPPKYTEWLYEDRDALILHSSGTTGLPKPIYHARGYTLTYAANHELPEEEWALSVSTLPLYHGFGLLAPSLSLSIGMPFILPPASVIPTARTTLQTLQTSGAKAMFSVPSILEDILRLPNSTGVEALKQLEFIVIGGAPMKETVAEELTQKGVRLLNHWGATELGAIATVQRLPAHYDWHYIIARKDIGLQFIPAGDGTFRLVGRAPGWEEDYEVQDLLLQNPNDPMQYRIMGRADDLMVLATGEKVRPAGMESALGEHPSVKDVLAFGEGREAMGVIVELTADVDESFWEYLEKGNSVTDKHAKVTREMVVFTTEATKPFIRTDKGSLQRKANLSLFENEINWAYERADEANANALPFPAVGGDLIGVLRGIVFDISRASEYIHGKADTQDFFEAGMDSLQATRLRKAILSSLRATPDLPRRIADADLENDFCFQYPSIVKVADAVEALMRGKVSAGGRAAEEKRIAMMEHMVEKYRVELRAFENKARQIRAEKMKSPPKARQHKTVLLTGSTGSLGCFLLKRLMEDPTVERVFCVNRARANGPEPRNRQDALMKKRGAVVDDLLWHKVKFLNVELSTIKWDDMDSELFRVTHVIHNAWPVNFNYHLASFESHVAGTVSLLKLAILASSHSPAPPRLLFASSVAVVGRYPVLHPDSFQVPETPLDAKYTADFGYPEAKWVCERIVQIAAHLYGQNGLGLLKSSSVRIGQMCGAEGVGAWNETEHFPIIIWTSKMLGALPKVEGSLSWIPVNRAGNAIVEMALSKTFREMYHMENPSRQSWRSILGDFASLLSTTGEPIPMIPYAEWLDKVRALGDKTPAHKVLNFLEQDFERMAAGKVILSTSETKKDSPTIVQSTSLDKSHLEEYLRYWETVM